MKKFFKEFWEWIRYVINKYGERAGEAIHQRDLKRVIVNILITVLFIVFWGCIALGLLVLIYYTWYIWFGIYLLVAMLKEILTPATTEEVEQPAPDPVSQEFAEANWINVANIMHQVIESCADPLGVVKPIGISDIDYPSAHVVCRGNVSYYLFALTKSNANADIDSDVFKAVIQNRLTIGLNNSMFDGITDKVVLIDGISYPLFMVDEVRDGLGMVTVLVVQPSADYIRQLRNRRQAQSFASRGGRPPEDKDI